MESRPGTQPGPPPARQQAGRLGHAARPWTALLYALLACPLPLAAQDDYNRRAWWSLWSVSSPADRVVAYMTTVHLNHLDEGWSNDKGVAVLWRGLYAGTFRTTHGPRGWTAGVERSWIDGSRGPLFGLVGFRAGLVYGYDGRLGWMAEEFPILPFAQPVLVGAVGPLTVDVSYAWVVLTVAAAVRF